MHIDEKTTNGPQLTLGRKPKVLLISEAVTLAHLVRPIEVASCLKSLGCEVALARSKVFNEIKTPLEITEYSITSIPPQIFSRRVRKGLCIFSEDLLSLQVEEDLRLLSEYQPDLVFGDMRASLATSSEISKIPYVNLSSAYWSPYAIRQEVPVPPHPLMSILKKTHLIGRQLNQSIESSFNKRLPKILDRHLKPLNHLRQKYSLSKFESYLDAFTAGTYTAYTDLEEIAPTSSLKPSQHCYIGPIIWEPDCALPEWWHKVPVDAPVVYLSLGSSGAMQTLLPITRALQSLGFTCLVSTGGKQFTASFPAGVFHAPYIPGVAASRKASFVITNGGSLSAYQALSVGKPILGIPTNIDQLMFMNLIEASQSGLSLRSDELNNSNFRFKLKELTSNSEYRAKAHHFSKLVSKANFQRRLLEELPHFLANTTDKKGDKRVGLH